MILYGWREPAIAPHPAAPTAARSTPPPGHANPGKPRHAPARRAQVQVRPSAHRCRPGDRRPVPGSGAGAVRTALGRPLRPAPARRSDRAGRGLGRRVLPAHRDAGRLHAGARQGHRGHLLRAPGRGRRLAGEHRRARRRCRAVDAGAGASPADPARGAAPAGVGSAGGAGCRRHAVVPRCRQGRGRGRHRQRAGHHAADRLQRPGRGHPGRAFRGLPEPAGLHGLRQQRLGPRLLLRRVRRTADLHELRSHGVLPRRAAEDLLRHEHGDLRPARPRVDPRGPDLAEQPGLRLQPVRRQP